MGESKLTPEMVELVQVLGQTMAEAMRQGQTPPDEWTVASEPMKGPIEEDEKVELSKLVLTPNSDLSKRKNLTPFRTGTFLDDIYLDERQQNLEGVPSGAQIAIVGMSGSGKSILVEEIAIRCASRGTKVLYVTGEDTWHSETPRFDLQSRLMQKVEILGLDWDTIKENLYILDTIRFPELREWKTFAEAYRYTCETNNIDLAILDSVTVLETSRFKLKYRVIELVRYNQIRGITGLFINQRTEEKADISGMSGGYGLDYQYDSTIVIDFTKTSNWTPKVMLSELECGKNEYVKFARILDCRLCGYDRSYTRLEITQDGFIRPNNN